MTDQNRGNLGCAICLRLFRSIQELERHKQAEHFRPTKSRTAMAGTTLVVRPSSSGNTSSQIQTVTVGIKRKKSGRYTCKLCKKKYSRLGLLRDHMRLHSGERPYKCPNCQEGFNSSKRLNYHLRKNVTTRDGNCLKFKFIPRQQRTRPATFYLGVNSAAPSTSSSSIPLTTSPTKTSQNVSAHPVQTKEINSQGRVYTCHFCPKRFITNDGRNKHMKETHTGERFYTCWVCKQGFVSLRALQEHKLKNRTNRSSGCSRMRMLREALTTASNANSNKARGFVGTKSRGLFECKECKRILVSVSNLETHMKMHRGDASFLCSHCPNRYYSATGLQNHQTKYHPLQKVQQTSQPDSESSAIENGVEQWFTCQLCGKTLNTPRTLLSHMKVSHPSKTSVAAPRGSALPIPGNSMTNSSGGNGNGLVTVDGRSRNPTPSKSKYRRRDRRGQFPCPYCGRNMSTKLILKQHLNTHTGFKPFGCPDCGENFKNYNARSRHRKICGKGEMRGLENSEANWTEPPRKSPSPQIQSRPSLSPLKSPQKPLPGNSKTDSQCNFCGRILYDRNSLIKHVRLHTGERPFKCELCSKPYASLDAVQKHLSGFHRLTKPTVRLNRQRDGKPLHSRTDRGIIPIKTEDTSKVKWRKESGPGQEQEEQLSEEEEDMVELEKLSNVVILPNTTPTSISPKKLKFTGWVDAAKSEPTRKFLSSVATNQVQGNVSSSLIKPRVGGPRTCPYCLIIFNSVTLALEHRQTCSKKGMTTTQCTPSAPKQIRITHVQSASPKVKKGPEPESQPESIDRTKLRRSCFSFFAESQESFQSCPHCHLKLGSTTELIAHLADHERLDTLRCSVCLQSFSSYRSMTGHQKSCPGKQSPAPNNVNGRKSQNSVPKRLFSGGSRRESTTTQSADLESDVGSPKLEPPANDLDLGSNVVEVVYQPWACPFCENVSATDVALKDHIRNTHI